MQVVIFSSPGRKRMMNRLIKELKGLDVAIIDSPETFGKDKFWMRWEQARQYCLASKHDDYLILPDDVSKLNIEAIEDLHKRLRGRRYVCSVINDGRIQCWGSVMRSDQTFTIGEVRFDSIGFFDCGGATNRETLKMFRVDPVPSEWFTNPNKSSGVGHQITHKLRKLRIPMYRPVPSLAYHGDHESVMHKEHRKTTPLISIK